MGWPGNLTLLLWKMSQTPQTTLFPVNFECNYFKLGGLHIYLDLKYSKMKLSGTKYCSHESSLTLITVPLPSWIQWIWIEEVASSCSTRQWCKFKIEQLPDSTLNSYWRLELLYKVISIRLYILENNHLLYQNLPLSYLQGQWENVQSNVLVGGYGGASTS